MKGLRRFAVDENGAAMVESALVAVILLVVLGGLIDFLIAFWQWNAATKATERGARIAATSNPVARGLSALNALANSDDTACTPGDVYPTYDPTAFTITCNGATQNCSGAPAGFNIAYDAAAMNNIVFGRGAASCGAATSPYDVGMCHIYPTFGDKAGLQPRNVVVRYRWSRLGFCGRPGGPVVTVSVSLQGIQYAFTWLRGLLGFAPIAGAAATTSITSEDLSSCDPSITNCAS